MSKDDWLHECEISVSALGDLIAIAREDRIAVLQGLYPVSVAWILPAWFVPSCVGCLMWLIVYLAVNSPTKYELIMRYYCKHTLANILGGKLVEMANIRCEALLFFNYGIKRLT